LKREYNQSPKLTLESSAALRGFSCGGAAWLKRSNVCFFNFSIFLKDRLWPIVLKNSVIDLRSRISKKLTSCKRF
jgi:hypothetical protein